MFEVFKFKRLASVEQSAPAILQQFSELLNARTLIHSYNDKNFRFLQIDKIDNYTIDATYHGTTIRFRLFLTYRENSAIGRVVCLYQYRLFEEIRFELLGQFTMALLHKCPSHA